MTCWSLCIIPTLTIREAVAGDNTDEGSPREPGYHWQRRREAAHVKLLDRRVTFASEKLDFWVLKAVS